MYGKEAAKTGIEELRKQGMKMARGGLPADEEAEDQGNEEALRDETKEEIASACLRKLAATKRARMIEEIESEGVKRLRS